MVVLLLAACIENGLHGAPDEVCDGVDNDGDGAVDDGFPDADANGRVDCLDAVCGLSPSPAGPSDQDATCTIPDPVQDPWAVRALWSFGAPAEDPAAVSSLTQPLIVRPADSNGDGAVDAADVAVVLTVVQDSDGHGWLVAIDGAAGVERWAVPDVSARTQLAAADVTGDGAVEVLAYRDDGRLVAFDADGSPVWTSAEAAPPAEDGWQVLVADVDGDGAAEVIADTMLLDGRTGAVRATFPVDTVTHQHRAPTVGDIDGDGLQEILIAGRVFAAGGQELWYSGEGVEDGVWSALVQLDTDDAAEVITLGANLVLSDDDGTTLTRSPTFARNASGGPCVGDFDGDGQPEFAYGAYDGFYVRDMDVRNVWYTPIDVATYAGQAACAGYDLDADGALEVLYADEHAFRIYDGRTGAVRFEDAAGYESRATWASPAAGDVDGDGDVEVVVVSSDPTLGTAVRVYTHDGEGWPAVTGSWPVMDYDAWNVGVDGSVPTAPAAPWLHGNGVRTAPVNPRSVDGADLAVALDDVCVADCVYGPVEVAARVSNRGWADAPAGAVLALYAVDGRVRRRVAGTRLGAVPAGASLDGVVFRLTPADVGADGFVLVVDDGGAVDECDEANNEAASPDGCPG